MQLCFCFHHSVDCTLNMLTFFVSLSKDTVRTIQSIPLLRVVVGTHIEKEKKNKVQLVLKLGILTEALC